MISKLIVLYGSYRASKDKTSLQKIKILHNKEYSVSCQIRPQHHINKIPYNITTNLHIRHNRMQLKINKYTTGN